MWKNFPENTLGQSPDFTNFQNRIRIALVDKFSTKPFVSNPKMLKTVFKALWKNFSQNPLGQTPRFSGWFTLDADILRLKSRDVIG